MKISVLPKLFFLISIAALCMQANAADLYVSSYGGDIQSAVNAATNAGDTVWVEDGTYVLSSEIHVTNAITVRGINGPTAAIVDGDGVTRCFYLEDEGCIIADLTIQNGYEYSGAGIYCDYSLATVSNCVIRNNVADPEDYTSGGGLYGGTAIDCLLSGNQASEGGGAAQSILVGCRLEGNAAASGGGLAYGSATNCLIINNSTIDGLELEISPGGGGIYDSTAYTCAISGNKTGAGGGGAYYGSLYNCTITANTANYGGGVYNANEIYNCIVWHNTVTGSGNGGGEPASFGSVAANAEYVSGSDLSDCWEVYYSCAPELNTFDTGNITNNPALVSLSHIDTSSPCIGAGTTNLVGGGGGGGGLASLAYGDDPAMTASDIDAEAWAYPPAMGCDENHGAGTLIGPLDLSIYGPALIATDYEAEYLFIVDGIPTMVVASIEGVGAVTNPVGPVEASWSTPGTNDLVLTAYNETYPGGVSYTQEVVVVSTAATAIHVAIDGDDSDDGSSWALAKETIQGGIAAQTVLGGWVLVADGTYTNEMFPIHLDVPVVVQSTNGAGVAIIDADGNERCVEISDGGAVLKGFTVQDGSFWDAGGGINCSAQGATVRECIVRDNYSGFSGGGMSGGTAINCSFYSNTSASEGSAIAYGTAIGCVLAYNESGGSGTAYYSELRNCTVVGNHAEDHAGGTYECDLYNTIVWHNTCADPAEGNDIYWGNIWSNVCSPDVEHGIDGCITNEPMLASCSHLATGSPCIGAGAAAEALETDIDGQAWLVPPAIGCDEYHGSGSVTGALALVMDGITMFAVDTPIEYSFIAIGPATQTVASFGDGTAVTNPIAVIEKSWSTPGLFDVVFTAWNDSYPGGVSITQQVTVVSEAASTIHVATDGDDMNDGSSWLFAKQTIQSGVDVQMIYGGRVVVSNGTYAIGSPVMIDFPLKLIGFGGRDETVIDCGESSQGLYINDPGAFVSGFCITNGYGSYGGGIRCAIGAMVSNCLVTACEATSRGGGIYQGEIVDCIIDDNRARNGGGISDCTAILCEISNNEASGSTYCYGGGAYRSTLYHCTVEGNSSARYGGGVYNSYTYKAHSCLIQNNTATRDGGGCYNGYYYNCTIVSNKTVGGYPGGGAAYSYLWNSIAYGNLRGVGQDDIIGGHAYSSCSPDVAAGLDGNITNAPAFADPDNGDFRLSAGSPCIDAGSNAVVYVVVDLDGNARIVGGTVDMGAYEYSATGPLDSDGDGMLDADELIAGTGINDPDDFFRVESISNTVAGMIVGWDAVVDRLYSVYWTGNLVDQPFTLLTNGLMIGGFQDIMHAGDTNGFYLIKVELAP
ncbi:choice-of-anchor Q domain-containing protein [Pontiella sulfatireligans]|uniref:Probable pectate lyase C n=1 Tax=Pontiella sulfatireligans TaxID=2750658 RepID=A0A6C2UNI9_9BACT|nr:choice-of-anchor Q domain-containing protein [Pontiella sulfatireligans]VGO21629.1 hypothetical protein SCARR_03703 [Pontiella sulfatireligans]